MFANNVGSMNYSNSLYIRCVMIHGSITSIVQQKIQNMLVFIPYPVVFILSIYLVESSAWSTGAILVNNNYPRCKDVNLHTQIIVCEIHSQEDEMKIERFGLSGCYGSTLSCAEGDIKTCMPLITINTLHYQCYCHSDEEDVPVPGVSYWTRWQKMSRNFRGFIYRRELLIDNEPDHIAEEYSIVSVKLEYIVSNNTLTDSVFTASSVYSTIYAPERARLDNYFNIPCCWSSAPKAPGEWVKISLPEEFEVIGVFIKQRCDERKIQYPTVIDVTTSVDDVSWQDVVIGEDIATRYSSYDKQGVVSVLFPRSYTTRYWKIEIVEFITHPSMKCDLIGYGA